MSAAYVQSDGTMVQLDRRAVTPAVVTSEDVKDVEKLARMLQDQSRRLTALERRWAPDVLYFRDRPVDGTGTTKYLFHHGLNGRVNYSVERWEPTASGDAAVLEIHADTDANTLVLISANAGSVTLRVEAAG